MKKIGLFITCVLLSGCYPQKTGPYNLSQDSIHYNQALQTSNDSQLLLNIVRLRYRDTPTFLQVGLISASYENTCAAGADFRLDALNQTNSTVSVTPRVSIERKEKPTTTFQAVRGEGFVREFLSPITLQSMLLLNSSGWKIDRIMRCCVQRLNGVRNAPTASGPTPIYAPEYEKFLELMRLFVELEKDNAIDLVLQREGPKGATDVYLVFDKDAANPNTLFRVWQILDVDQGLEQVRLVPYHGTKHCPKEVNVDMRSPLSLLYFLSHGVEIPEIDKLQGKVTRTADVSGYEFDWQTVLDGVLTVRAKVEPCEVLPAASVCYRGHYFYIDDRDLDSKSTFSLLSQLLALQITCPDLPVTAFTIPLTTD